ncbi:flagellar hook-length control protein FliK [Agathobacter sp.]
MAGTNVSAVTPVPTVAAASTGTKGSTKSTDFGFDFKSLLNNSSASGRNSTQQPQPSYDTYKVSSNAAPRTIQKAGDTSKVSDKDIKDIEEDVTSAITETVTKDLDISEEQLADIMQMLGITAMDLLQPDNLAALYANITGTDNVQDVILNSQFTDILSDLSTIASDYSDQIELLSGMEQVITPEQITVDTAQQSLPDNDDTVAAVNTEGDHITDTDVKGDTVEVEIKDTVSDTVSIVTDDDQSNNDQAKSDKQENNHTDNDFQSRSANTSRQPEASGVLHASANEPVFQEISDISPEAEPVRIDTMDIIRQIAERISISGTTAEDSTIEMQLNPENLGKIYINVSEKNSEITARIAVSNEAVKEALETQMIELRETLNNSGVKVNAVEVTVASHEFEQNLEQNTASDEQRQHENAFVSSDNNSGTGRTSFTDDAPEEEILAQRIMKDNGNSVDFTA